MREAPDWMDPDLEPLTRAEAEALDEYFGRRMVLDEDIVYASLVHDYKEVDRLRKERDSLMPPRIQSTVDRVKEILDERAASLGHEPDRAPGDAGSG